VTCEDLTPVKTEEFSSEGSNVTLSYKAGSAANYYFWYRQYPGKPPEFLISHSVSGTVGTNPIPGLKITVESNRINLIISSAAVTDSAVYYCALQPTVTGNTNTLYINLWSKDNTILHSIHQRESLSFPSVNMEKLAAILLCSALIGNSLEDALTASSAEVFSSEGRSVTLSCTYSVKADNLQWYRQHPGSAPQFLLLIIDTKQPYVVEAKPPIPRLNAKLNEERNQVDLQISSAAVTDSAVYYCALRPTVTGNTTLCTKTLEQRQHNTAQHPPEGASLCQTLGKQHN
ncbi:hypothetical protein NQZ68_038530, partial [Dissostichus eleginoides]